MNNTIEKLEKLKGASFTLGAWDAIDKKKYILNAFKENVGTTVLFTDTKTFNILNSDLPNFLEEIEVCLQPETVFVPKKETVMKDVIAKRESQKVNLTIFEPTAVQNKTQDALSDMLDKVMAGEEGAIEKAKSVCEIANTMVNMEKSQIQLLRLANKMK